MQLTPSDRFAPAANVLSKDLGGEQVLLDLKSGHYFGLNEVGAQIWQLIEGGASIAVIYETLLAEYPIDRDTLETDASALVSQLLERGLIEKRPSSA